MGDKSRRDPDTKKKKEKKSKKSGGMKLPPTYVDFAERFPALAEAHESVSKAADALGPLDPKTCELVKIGICLGAGLESAVRSHTRRALAHGASPAEIEQVIALGMTSCGFPRTVAAWSWARPLFE